MTNEKTPYQRKREWNAPQPIPNVEIHTLNENKDLYVNAKKIKYQVNENGCHICISHAGGGDGYPGIVRDRKSWVMSRYVWSMAHETIPDNLCIMHSCDTPRCINIEHLSLGTHKENMDDLTRKNRRPDVDGFNNPNAVLAKEDIIGIKNDLMITPPLRQIDIAKKYGVQRTAISRIQREIDWADIIVDGFEPKIRRNSPNMLTESQILDVFFNKSNLTIKELASEYKIAPSTVSIIKSGQTFQGVRVKEGALV